MGAVYLAIDQKFGSRVAVKETFYQKDHLGEAFEREARLLNSLHHPVLPHVSDYFIEDGKHFLLMEYIDGEDLSEILEREGPFPVETVLRWADELLDALDYLHSQEPPIIHRDIKPNNLKLTSRGNLVLLDFGLAKLNSDDTMGVKSVFGFSRRYSPLEQIQGTGTDARSDMFALGATVFHLLTGKTPVDVLARAATIVAGNPDPLPLISEINAQVPISVAQVFHTALALNAERRFKSAIAMRKALEFAVKTISVAAENKATFTDNIKFVKQIAFASPNESFPALEAFVADASQQNEGEKQAQIQIDVQSNEQELNENQTGRQAEEVETHYAKPPHAGSKRSFAVAACLVALLAVGFLVFRYSAYQAKVSNETPQSTVVESSPAPEITAAENVPVIPESDAPLVETSSAPVVNPNAAQSRDKSSVKSQKDDESRKTDVEEKPAASNLPAENPVQTRKQTPARSAENLVPTRRRQTPPSVVNETAPASSIETVMTGLPSDRQQRREARKRWRQMSDSERDAVRRHRMEDVRRHNRRPF